MRSSAEIRQQFLDFFAQRCGHTIVPSSPVVPHDDPTLLFANAGMNQFKDVFLGIGRREYTRAVNSQKCIRAGGKHNDLEDVGRDTYHHTFFEMLGNWSFGDYFKREAIEWAWKLLTEVWGLEKRRLHVTVFEGAAAQGLARDQEAAGLWRSVTDIIPSHIHSGSMKDNFWEMGEAGPCGPCTEIHIDRTPDASGAALVNKGDARVIELWNLVFIQFNRDAAGQLHPLPACHVDTGMGFERLCAVLQGKASNYDTDVFAAVFAAIQEVTGAGPYSGQLQKPEDIAYRVIADHIRALVFALSDGAEPSNEGRGYVLRRILRRAARHGRQTLGAREPFLHRLVKTLAHLMAGAYPELLRDPGSVTARVREEEELFDQTLDRGLARFNAAAAAGAISGAAAFELFATYGFPLDLTSLMAEERGIAVDFAAFDAELDRHRDISRGAGESVDARNSLIDVVTARSLPATVFSGHHELSATNVRILAALELDNSTGSYASTATLGAGRKGALVVERTPFYAEAGGQVGDRGVITMPTAIFRVHDTVRVGQVVFHLGAVESGDFSADQCTTLQVDRQRRTPTMAHHTVTHVMNHKLRAVLGDHVQQKGSLVDEHKTRFDFSHPKPLELNEIERIEAQVNADIAKNLPVYAGEGALEAARSIHGLRAVFGEKYPPNVRIVSIGVPVFDLLADPSQRVWYDYSIEFCGGTHLKRTGEAGRFVVVGEEAVAKGIRRITAVAGDAAEASLLASIEALNRINELQSAPPDSLEHALAMLQQKLGSIVMPLRSRSEAGRRIAELQAKLKEWQKSRSKSAERTISDQARGIANEPQRQIYVRQFAEADNDALGKALDVMRQVRPDAAHMAVSTIAAAGRVFIRAWVPKALIAKGLKAGDWVKTAAAVVGGGGGGRPDMAQAGGKDPAKLPDAIDAAWTFAQKIIESDQ